MRLINNDNDSKTNRSYPAVFLWGTGVDWGIENASVFTNL